MKHPNSNNRKTNRRRFLSYLVGLAGLLLVGLVSVPMAALSLFPAFKRRKETWLDIGPLADVVLGDPTAFTYRYNNRDGYLDQLIRGTVYVVAENLQSFTVFSNICTHAGCAVRWEPDKQVFYCPCHNGMYNINGQVAAGPPPRPLDRFPYKVVGGRILIKIKGA